MKRSGWITATVLSVMATGCPITPTFTTGYRVPRTALGPEAVEGALAVRRFEEGRPPRYYTTTGRAFLTYVPLLPYVSMPFERLDESVKIHSDEIMQYGPGVVTGARQNVAPDFEQYAYPASVARAIADDLAASGLFREVKYVGVEEPAGSRYVLSGTLTESPLRSTGTSYGLGAAGVLLWLLPLPMQKTTASISVDLVLTDTSTGQVLWRDTLTSEVSRTATMYNGVILYGRRGGFSFNLLPLPASATEVDRHSLFSWHFEALRRAMEKARPDLARALQAS